MLVLETRRAEQRFVRRRRRLRLGIFDGWLLDGHGRIRDMSMLVGDISVGDIEQYYVDIIQKKLTSSRWLVASH